METLSTSTGIKSVLTISQVIKEDEGLYECGMTNPFGNDAQPIKIVVRGKLPKVVNKATHAGNEKRHTMPSTTYLSFIVAAEPPHEPRNLKVLEATSTSARLSWEATRPSNPEDSLPINSFTIEWTPLQGERENFSR